MKITVTLEDEIVAKLNDRTARSGASFEETLNELLRRALEQPTDEKPARPFRIQLRSMGLRPGIELDNISSLLDSLDGPEAAQVLAEPESGFRPFASRGGVVTNELINRLREETGD